MPAEFWYSLLLREAVGSVDWLLNGVNVLCPSLEVAFRVGFAISCTLRCVSDILSAAIRMPTCLNLLRKVRPQGTKTAGQNQTKIQTTYRAASMSPVCAPRGAPTAGLASCASPRAARGRDAAHRT